MRVLLITHLGTLNPRATFEVQSLIEAGYTVRVVYFERQGTSQKAAPKARKAYEETYIAVKAPTRTWRLLFVLPIFYAKAVIQLRHEAADVVHCTHLFLLPLALILGRILRTKVLYDAFDKHSVNWSEYAGSLGGAVKRTVEWFEARLVARTDCVLTTDSVGDSWAARYRRVNQNVAVLFHVPPREIRISEDAIARARQALEGRITVAHVGDLREDTGLTVALEALDLVRKRFPAVTLLCVGHFYDPRGLTAQLMQGELKNHVQVIPWLPYSDMLAYLEFAKVGLCLYQPLPRFANDSLGTPRKPFTYMQAGVPIIGPSALEICRVVKEEHCGLLVDTADAAAVADAIIQLLSDPDLAGTMGERGRRAVMEKYNWETEQLKMLEAYGKLGSRTATAERVSGRKAEAVNRNASAV